MNYTTKTAVLVVAFRRADLYEQTLRAVREARPPRLYVALDAPREHVPGEKERCAQTAARTAQIVDWPCEIFLDQATRNLGMNLRVSSAIDWIFRHEERAIIIEEDCLAHPSFFHFCDELLERYGADERIAMISGNQFVPGGWPCNGASYTLARLAQVWGWASWRRAWRNYDHQMKAWPEERRRGQLLRRTFPNPRDRTYWRKNFDDLRTPGCWDYRWCFTRWRHDQHALVPAVNLCTNLGFGSDATNTKGPNHPAANVPLTPMSFPLRHPAHLALDDALDEQTARLLFSEGGFPAWWKYQREQRLGRWFPGLFGP